MKKKLRKISSMLILIPIIGNVYSLTKIRNLEDELEKERNPSLIAFSWTYYEGYSQIDFWQTWKEARESSHKVVCPNSGKLSITVHKAASDFLYMDLWDTKHLHDGPMNAHHSHLGGTLMEISTTLTESGLYIVGVNYNGVNLFSALEVTIK